MNKETQYKTVFHENGKTYFSKETERQVFFLLTVIMLIFGIMAKTGIF